MMDWQQLADGLRAWFAQRSGCDIDDVMWAGEPEGIRGYPCAWLSLLAPAADVGTDEIILHSQGAGNDALVQLRGNRLCTLSCKLRTRDQSPNGRAMVALQAVRDSLQLPTVQAQLRRLGVSVQETRALLDLGRVFDLREESEAVLDLRLAFVVDTLPQGDASSASDSRLYDTVGTIEHVIVSGTVTLDTAIAEDVPATLISRP